MNATLVKITNWRITMANIAPIVFCLVGLVLSLWLLIYFAIRPTLLLLLFGLLLTSICYYFKKYIFLGVGLAIVSAYFNFPSLYQTPLSNCDYNILINKRGYYTSAVEATAKNIICNDKKIANQSILIWDSKKQLQMLGVSYTVQSDLIPINKRINYYDFDYQRYLYSQDVVLEAKNLLIKSISSQPISLKQRIDKIRTFIQKQFQQQLSPNHVAIAIALTTGDRGFLTDQQKSIIQQSATQHILAISGLHLTLVGGFSWLFIQFVWSFIPKLNQRIAPIQAGAVCAWLIISFYTVISGLGLPTQRAWIMFSTILFAWVFLRSININTLLFALLIILLIDPLSLLNSSLYLSFLATYVVIWTVAQRWSALTKIIVMQVLICITLTPVIWVSFGVVPVAGLLSNLIVIPWLTFALLPSLLLSLLFSLSPFELITQNLWQFTDFTVSALQATLTWTASLNWNLTPSWTPSILAALLSIAGILGWMIYRQKIFLLMIVVPLLPINFVPQSAEILIADRKQTSVLIHNGKEAIIINPGWRYQRRDDSELWLKTLRAKNLTLKAIVLSDNRSSLAAATKTLLKHAPNSEIIMLQDKDFPFSHSFCRNFAAKNLSLINVQKGKKCQSTLYWMGQTVSVFHSQSVIQIQANNILSINGNEYNSRELGMLTLTSNKGQLALDYAKQSKKLWRQAIVLTEAE